MLEGFMPTGEEMRLDDTAIEQIHKIEFTYRKSFKIYVKQ